ncbi:Transcriptional regulator, TetR family [hydrothermal vent metagenome]|uniref:Transcriptional regulator, TetR family n=1 Tax=hydrothermal vent metagenome TaxID=652676 RepID=A0A1W1CQW1_9ZZZZ
MKKPSSREKLLDITFDEVYIHGYTATSVDTILKKTGIPKGSMYHYFKGKKALVTAMVQERLFPKMDTFFIFERRGHETVMQSLRQTYAAMSKNKPLVTYGCPLYRLMVELSAVDSEFDALLGTRAKQLQKELAALLQSGIDDGEFSDRLVADRFSRFMLSATWGILSLPPSLSSARSFLEQSRFILETLEAYTG